MFESGSSEQSVPSQRTRSDELFEHFLETWLEGDSAGQTLMDVTLAQPSPHVDAPALKPYQAFPRPGFTMNLNNPYEVDPFTQALRVPAIPVHQVYMPMEQYVDLSTASRPAEPARRAGKGNSATVLEKNRKAQARFRDKQKQKERDLQEQVQELQRQLKEAHMEAVCAKRQNEVLSKVLELRETNIHVLKENARLIEQPPPPPAAQFQPSAAQVPEDGPPKATLEECRGIDRVAAAARWRDYVQSMATHLVSVELAATAEGGDAMARLEAVTIDALAFVQLMSVVNPGVARKMVNTYMDSLEAADTSLPRETLRDEGWRSKLDALMLTEEQVEKIRFLFSRHKDTIERLDRELEPHKSVLDTLMPIASSEPDDKCRISDEGPATLQHNEVVSFLRRNIQLRSEAWSGLGIAILGKILTPLQCARFCVTSYPMFPICHQVLAFVEPSFCAAPPSSTQ